MLAPMTVVVCYESAFAMHWVLHRLAVDLQIGYTIDSNGYESK